MVITSTPVLRVNNPGGSGAAHLDIQAERLIFDSNVSGGKLDCPTGERSLRWDRTLFNVAIALKALGDPGILGGLTGVIAAQ